MLMERKYGEKLKQKFPEVVINISIVLILVGMQLYYHNYYYDISEAKYYYYLCCAIPSVLLCLIYIIFVDRKKLDLRGKKILEVFSWTDIMVFLFMILALLSTLMSPFKYEAFWGNEGRLTGAFLISVYSMYYFCATRFYKPRRWHIEAFLIAGILMCLLGITDSFDLDLLGFKREIMPSHKYIFTSTIGNINVYTACVAMVMAVSVVLFVSSSGIKSIWYGFCTVVTFAAIVIGMSDNAYLALAMLFAFLPVYLFCYKDGVCKFAVLLAIFLSVLYGIRIEQEMLAGVVEPITSVFTEIVKFRIFPLLVILMWVLVAVLYVLKYRDRKLFVKNGGCVTSNKADGKFRIRIYIWCGILAMMCAVILWILYDVNVAGNVGRYPGLENYLLFNDNWGTERGFAWRIAIENYCEFPIIQKLIGYGPETFSLVAYFHNYSEMISRHNAFYDNVHNEYLQYLVTVGVLGLGAYLGIIITLMWNVIKKKKDNPVAVACLFAVLCYAAQAIVNIGLPISTPIMWTLLCMAAAKQQS